MSYHYPHETARSQFLRPLEPAVLIKRYKRFLADVELPKGRRITVHCPNSGSMLGCSTPGSPVYISASDNPGRKYVYTLEMVRVGATWVGINTSLTNHLVREAFELGIVTEIGQVDDIRAEVKTSAHSRLDFLLSCGERRIYVEVKNCSLAEDNVAMFPDAVTRRGTKHLHELMVLKKAGYEAVVFFCVQRQDVTSFALAAHIDPVYSKALIEAKRQGVVVLAYQAEVSPRQIEIKHPLPVII